MNDNSVIYKKNLSEKKEKLKDLLYELKRLKNKIRSLKNLREYGNNR